MKLLSPIAHSFCLTSLNSRWLQRFLITVLLIVLLFTSATAQIARRGATTTFVKSTAAGTTMTLTKPTGVVAGDLIMMTYAGNSNTSHPSLAGWSVITMSSFGKPSILYKVAGTSEPTSYTFTVDAVTAVAGMFAFSGVDVSGDTPFEALGCNVRWTNWDQLTTCGITTQYDGAAILMITSVGTSSAFSGWGATSPATLSEILDINTTGAAIGAAWAVKPTAGATGDGKVTLTPYGNVAYPFLLALKRKPVIARRGATTTAVKSTAAGTTMTLNKPTGVIAGDLLMMAYAGNSNSSHPSLAGWSVIPMNFGKPSILYKVAGASEPASYTFTVDAVTGVAGMFAFSDVDVSGASPFEALGCNTRWTNWDLLTTCGVTTQYDGAGLLMITSVGTQSAFSAWGATTPATLAEILDINTTGAAIGAAWAVKPTPGATGDGKVTLTPYGNVAYPFLLALKRRQSCLSPSIPVLSSTSMTNCGTQSTTLSISSGNLNSASNWQWYSGSCGGTSIGSGTSVVVSPQVTKTYYARGEGGCVTPGQCASITIAVNNPSTYYVDADGDGYGSTATASFCSLTAPAGYSTNNTDCNDNDANIHAPVLYYVDADGDGYGSTTTAMLCSSTAPAGYSTNNTDCNDNDPNIHAPVQYYVDADGDGYGSTTTAMLCSSTPPAGYSTNNTDCDDNDATVYPGAPEICDGKDNNCNGVIDEGFPTNTYYRDADGDGYGDPGVTTTAKCNLPEGYVTDNTDCNDNDANIHAPVLYYVDADGDGYGSTTPAMLCSSTAPAGYSTNNTDCNDNDPNIHAPVQYYVDADGDGYGSTTTAMLCSSTPPAGYSTNNTDCNDNDANIHAPVLYYVDADGDGYGSTTTAMLCSSTPPAGYSTNNTDCNDNDPNIHAPVQYYVDADGDGYGSTTTAMLCSSTAPAGYSTNNTDCNDTDANIHAPVQYYVDADGDGYGSTTTAMLCSSTPPAGYSTNNTDCNDNDPNIHAPVQYYVDADGDGYGSTTTAMLCSSTPPAGYSTNNTDCNDNDANIHAPVQYYVDADGDGYGSTTTAMLCSSTAPAGYSTNNTDCDDNDATVYPGAPEICDGKDNNCNGVIDEGFPTNTYYRDADGDGYGNPAVTTTAKCNPPAGYVTDNTDCNDADAGVHTPIRYYPDADGDGYGIVSNKSILLCSSVAPAGYSPYNTDCNDKNAAIHPGAPELCDGIDNNCDGQIDEGCPQVTISLNDVTITEGNSGKKTLTFTVTLSQASTKTVTVNYGTADGTATAPSDYTAKSGSLSFKAGTVTQQVSITIVGDKTIEPDEIFYVILSNPANAIIYKGTGTGTILNDDGNLATTLTVAPDIENETTAEFEPVVKLWPNPANNVANLQLKGYTGNVIIQLFSPNGKILSQQRINAGKAGYQLKFDLSAYSSGIYLVSITDQKGNRHNEKVILIK